MGFSLGSATINDVKLGSSQVSELYLGLDKFWPEITGLGFFIGGKSYIQTNLETKLTGETIVFFDNTGGNTVVTSSTNYTISSSFNGFAFEPITSYIDNGNCVGIGQAAFFGCASLAKIEFPNVTVLDNSVVDRCTALIDVSQTSNTASLYIPSVTIIGVNTFNFTNIVAIDLPYVTFIGATAVDNCPFLKDVNLSGLVAPNGLGGNPEDNLVFLNNGISGSATFPIAFATNNAGNPDGDIQALLGKGWTITYV